MFFPFCKPSQYEGFVKADFPGSWDKSIRGPAGEFPLSRSRTLLDREKGAVHLR